MLPNNVFDFGWLISHSRAFCQVFNPITLQTRENLIFYMADRSRLITLVSDPRGNPYGPGFCGAAKVELLGVVVALDTQVLEEVAQANVRFFIDAEEVLQGRFLLVWPNLAFPPCFFIQFCVAELLRQRSLCLNLGPRRLRAGSGMSRRNWRPNRGIASGEARPTGLQGLRGSNHRGLGSYSRR